MQNRKLAKQFGCFLLAASLAVSGTSVPMTSQAKATAKYYNKTKTVTFKDSKGLKKVTVNGKKKKIKTGAKKVKITFKKEGKYVVKLTNRKKKVTTRTIYIDKTTPSITGAKNGQTYTGPVTITAKDKYGISSFKVNGSKVKSPYKTTISANGEYTVLAEDKAGNIRKITFAIASERPSTASGDVVSSGAVTSTGSSTTSWIPNAPVGPVIPGIDNSGVEDKTPTVGCSHIWVLQKVEEEPTCYSSGIAKYTCITCGGTKRDEIAKADHTYTKLVTDERYEVKKATCTEAGEYYYCCQYCGAKGTQTGKVDPLGHKFNKRVATAEYLKEAATLEHGDIYYLACANCGEKGTETWDNERKLDHTAHTFTDTSVKDESNLATKATCTKPATYYYKCTGCNTFDTEHTFEAGTPLGHDFSEKTLKEAATCLHGNIYDNKCSRPDCEEFEGKAEDDEKKVSHDFSVMDTSSKYSCNKATCTSKATYYYKCATCDESAENYDKTKIFETGELKPHDFTAEVSNKDKYFCNEATCQHGTEYYCSCSKCGSSSKGTSYEKTFFGNDVESHQYTVNSKSFVKESATCSHGTTYYNTCVWCNTSSEELYSSLENQGVSDTELSKLVWKDNTANPNNHCYVKKPLNDNKHIAKEATYATPTQFYQWCEWCNTINYDLPTFEDTSVTFGKPIDQTLPTVEWRLDYGKTLDGIDYYLASKGPMSGIVYCNGEVECPYQTSKLTIKVADTGGSAIKRACYISDNESGDRLNEYLDKLKNDKDGIWENAEICHTLPCAYTNEGSAETVFQPYSVDYYKKGICYIYIYVEDRAGNATIVRTADLYK